MPEVEIVNAKKPEENAVESAMAEGMQDEGGSQKSVLQSKLTKLAIQIGYAGTLSDLI